MKNVCLAIKSGKSEYTESEYLSVVDGFRAGGYAFEEIRIVYQTDDKKLTALITELKEQADNLLVLTDKKRLQALSGVVATLYKETVCQASEGAGIFAENKKTAFLLSAGDGAEGKIFLQNSCLPYLAKKYARRLDKLVIRAMGANELRVEQLIARVEALAQGKIRVERTRKYDEDVLEIFYDETAPKMLVDDVMRILLEGLEDTVYALNDTRLEEQLVELLKLRGKKISVAESFTGGGIAKKIVSVSGASEVYFEGLNTYNERSKIKRLGVSEYTLGTMGAVSDQTAYEMAAGLIATGDCDISIATTGLAGPKTDRSMLPVGLCFLAVGTKESVFVYRYKFDGTREEITQKAIHYAMFLAYKQLKTM